MEPLYLQALQLTPHRHGVLRGGTVTTGAVGEPDGPRAYPRVSLGLALHDQWRSAPLHQGRGLGKPLLGRGSLAGHRGPVRSWAHMGPSLLDP